MPNKLARKNDDHAGRLRYREEIFEQLLLLQYPMATDGEIDHIDTARDGEPREDAHEGVVVIDSVSEGGGIPNEGKIRGWTERARARHAVPEPVGIGVDGEGKRRGPDLLIHVGLQPVGMAPLLKDAVRDVRRRAPH